MKKTFLIFFISLFGLGLWAAENSISKFIKGDITTKTTAVREASGDDVIWLSNEAIEYVLEYKNLLGQDRDLEGLAVAAILSIPTDYCSNASEKDKQALLTKFINLFQAFNGNSTVQIAVLAKFLYLKDIFPTESFTEILNDYLRRTSVSASDSSIIKAVINTLGTIGNNTSFIILYNYLNNSSYIQFKTEIEQSIQNLVPISMNEIIQIVNTQELENIEELFTLIQKNKNISKNNLSDIAENVLNVAILKLGNTTEQKELSVKLQMDSIRILNNNRWTRASNIALTFFEIAMHEFDDKTLSESEFVEIINALNNVAPINAITPLTSYLVEINKACDRKEYYSENVVIAVINTLGAIGDKTAFDSLLAVTYLSYPESVLSAAREALAGLKW